MTVETLLGKQVAELDPPVRGDPITGERYYSPAWAQAEWDKVFTHVWHIGGMAADLEETGDYVTHNLGRESILMIRQEDGGVKAFFNACRHRGNRLVWSELGGADAITCSYHGWRWGPDGVLQWAQDAEDFPGGNPCGKLRLVEIPCTVWGGFVWFNMDENAPPLSAWLGLVAEQLDAYQMEKMTRVLYLTAHVPCNWKVIRDNFNESYHLPTLHPELATFINDDHTDTIFEMFPNEHNRMIMKGVQPTRRTQAFDIVEAPLDDILRAWDLDPADFEGRAHEAREAVQKQKRKLARAKGYHHYEKLSDSQLTDYYHYTLFPNLTFTMGPDGFQVLRSEPDPADPEKCFFDHWYIVPPIDGMDEVETPVGMLPFAPAERVRCHYGERSLGFVADQDLSIAVGQQQGLHSRGYTGGHLSNQEKRIQRFHEILDDYVAGKR
ncbi:MAG: aromatic ring-hydroxylating dioxygenase subunit alpha [Alphaproteobacteria bacterium]|nr:MAG: aromatic ring-hydroxylating dioxygenase subunit alpha [Alphaproteobacteria bacterium]